MANKKEVITENKTEEHNIDILTYFKKNNLINLLCAIFDKEDLGELNKSIGAIDIGYGNTKYLSGIKENGDLDLGIFPSITPIAPAQNMTGGFLGKRDTKIIELEGMRYEVGKDADLTANNTDTTRNLNENYIFSDQYKVLFYGALLHMNKTHYDCLVLGLPVNNMRNAEKLAELFKGEHKINGEYTVNIDHIIVVPQPLGGFYDIAITHKQYFSFINETNLIIDTGYLTYDFLTLSGLKPLENRSDALKGGMSRVLNTIAKSISTKFNINYTDYSAIDKAIRNPQKIENAEGVFETKRLLKIAGTPEDLTEHITRSAPAIENSIAHMHNVVQNYNDIDNIMLVGGCDNVFEKKIKESLKRDILKTKNSVYSNVTGFFFIAVLEYLNRIHG